MLRAPIRSVPRSSESRSSLERLKPTCIGFCFFTLSHLLLLSLSGSNVSAQQPIAQDAYAIFEQKCLICHGPDGAYRETLLIEHTPLIENGTVMPGNPEASELYKRLLTTDTAKRMPLGSPPLSAPAIDTIRRWILAGAPDWAAIPPPDSRFIPPGEILDTIENHVMSLTPFDRAFARYFTLTHLYNAGETAEVLKEYRNGLSKLVNSLSWEREVTNPQSIDPQGTIFYIDLRHYEWDRNDGWTQIEGAYPYHIAFDAPTETALREQLTRLQTEMDCDVPSIHIDWFLATASLPPLYHELLSLPLTDRELETRLEVDVVRNRRDAPGVDVWRAGFNNSGVSNNNRVVERHSSRYGAYWKSYDFAGNVGTQNIFTHPLNFTHDGGEVIFNLPNGLQGYYLVNGTGFRLDAAPIKIVSNPAASDPTVRNGLSCMGCHTEGMKTFEDEVRSVIEANATPAYDKAQALRLYVEQSEMNALVLEDMDLYRQALEATGGVFGGIEPISRFHEAFQGPVDAAHAAAAVGLTTEAFIEKIRENVGLQNVGLLVLDSENGRVKRDTWTSKFLAVLFALDFPEQVEPPEPPPPPPPGTVVHIPDPNLRAAIAEELGKSPNAPITVEEMGRLKRLEARSRGIRELIGLQFATNLNELIFEENQISDLSPLAGLINLRDLTLERNPVSDLSPLRGLKNLTRLGFSYTLVSDLSPLTGLINLRDFDFHDIPVSDLSPLAGLINLEDLTFGGGQIANISNLSPLAGLINLKWIHAWGNPISDLSPLRGLTKLWHLYLPAGDISDLTPLADLTSLKELYLGHNDISDISPLAGLTGLNRMNLDRNDISDVSSLAGLTHLEWLNLGRNNISNISPLADLTSLKELYLGHNDISDISPLAGLTNLKWMDLSHNDILNVTPLVGLTNLKWLAVNHNEISDLSPLVELHKNITVTFSDNPGFPKGGPKIEGPWLWVLLPDREIDSSTDLLSAASEGVVTEVGVSTHGATEGKAVSDDVWTSHRLSPTGSDNIGDMLKESIRDGVLYGTVSLYSPRQQETTIYVGSEDESKVWLNGELIYQNLRRRGADDYQDFSLVTLKQGKNVLLVAVEIIGDNGSVFLGFEPDTDYVVSMGLGYTFSKTPIHVGDTFILDIRAENVFDLAGWQFDIAFDSAALEAIDVDEGDFLKSGGATFFQGGRIENAAGKITGLTAARLTKLGASGSGSLVQVTFKAKSGGETDVALQNFQFGAITGESIPAGPHEIRITVEGQLATGDVNRDGQVSILDLILVAQQLGETVPTNSPVDVNGDGVVSILDLIRVAAEFGTPAAPPVATMGGLKVAIEAWIADARLADDGSVAFQQGIENLQKLLASLIPEETALHPNYPNPFNPETWIPYHLAKAADVQIHIYDVRGVLVRRFDLGYQIAGYYVDRPKAAYWDGRNNNGELVASGVYFYMLSAGDFTETRRMVILK